MAYFFLFLKNPCFDESVCHVQPCEKQSTQIKSLFKLFIANTGICKVQICSYAKFRAECNHLHIFLQQYMTLHRLQVLVILSSATEVDDSVSILLNPFITWMDNLEELQASGEDWGQTQTAGRRENPFCPNCLFVSLMGHSSDISKDVHPPVGQIRLILKIIKIYRRKLQVKKIYGKLCFQCPLVLKLQTTYLMQTKSRMSKVQKFNSKQVS